MNRACIVYKTLDFVAKKWSLLILLELHKGGKKSKRYSELKKKLPDITPKMLAARLKELEENELVLKRIDSNVRPIKCEYSLTKSGKEFIKIIQDIKLWSLKWKFNGKKCKNDECLDCEI